MNYCRPTLNWAKRFVKALRICLLICGHDRVPVEHNASQGCEPQRFHHRKEQTMKRIILLMGALTLCLAALAPQSSAEAGARVFRFRNGAQIADAVFSRTDG